MLALLGVKVTDSVTEPTNDPAACEGSPFFPRFLARDAISRPRNSLEPLHLDLRAAFNTLAKPALLQSFQRVLQYLQGLASACCLVHQTLPFVLVRRLIRRVSVLDYHRPCLPLGRSKHTLHFCNARFEELLEILSFLGG